MRRDSLLRKKKVVIRAEKKMIFNIVALRNDQTATAINGQAGVDGQFAGSRFLHKPAAQGKLFQAPSQKGHKADNSDRANAKRSQETDSTSAVGIGSLIGLHALNG